MNAIILSVGNELTTGQTVDTNSAYLARRLGELGILPVEHRTVGDDRAAIARAITEAATRADIVLVSGGLGPTADDLTRAALADALGTPLELDPACLAQIEEFFRLRGRPMVESNKLQAFVPRGAVPLENHVGTAPGLFARIGEARVFVCPGVPSEMQWMYDHGIAPRLPKGQGVILYRILHSFGRGESDIGMKIQDLMEKDGPVRVGTTVAAGMVSVRIISRAADLPAARAQADATAAEIRTRLGELYVGEESQTMASVVGDSLRARKQTLATAESCTGGMIGQLMTSVAGSSEYYVGGVIAYENRLKEQLLGVPHDLLVKYGAVSEPVAWAMADGARQKLAAHWAISITGIAGPGGGTEQKPVGLVYIGIAGPEGTKVHREIFPGVREIVRLRSSLSALNRLRLELLKP